jgi:hypothetical protein
MMLEELEEDALRFQRIFLRGVCLMLKELAEDDSDLSHVREDKDLRSGSTPTS